jgi:hypothetical protein
MTEGKPFSGEGFSRECFARDFPRMRTRYPRAGCLGFRAPRCKHCWTIRRADEDVSGQLVSTTPAGETRSVEAIRL